MTRIINIFTDAATSPQVGVAVGVTVCFDSHELLTYSDSSMQSLFATLAVKVIYTNLESNKSTWSEIKNMMGALEDVRAHYGAGHVVNIYTDCQSLCDLLEKRKEKLISNHFMTRSGKRHAHADLYQSLFAITAQFTVKTIKLKGHYSKKDDLSLHEKIFSIIDKLARERLRSVVGL
mgnify:CR=1 FL=1